MFDSDGWTVYHLMLVMCTLYCVSIAAMQRKGQMKITHFVVGSICHWMAYLVKYSCLCLPVCRSVFVRLCICICECEYRAEGEGGHLKMRECGGDRLAREVTLPGRRNSQIWSTIPANIWRTIPDTFLEENSGEEEVILLGRQNISRAQF